MISLLYKREKRRGELTFVVPVWSNIRSRSSEVVVLGDIRDDRRDVASFKRDPRTDLSIDTVTKSADLNWEVIRKILSSQTLHFRLEAVEATSVSGPKEMQSPGNLQ